MTRVVTVRDARPGDAPAVLGVLDAAALETDADRVRAAVERGDALVAVPAAPDRATVVGALVLDGNRIANVAVRRRRRDRGIGSALVDAAADRVRGDRGRDDALVAEFEGSQRPFYESLGFAVEPLGGGRYRGVLDAAGE
ncbi:MAG: GNAT family N-acetyltransferase [Haloarculaceae archaeon]